MPFAGLNHLFQVLKPSQNTNSGHNLPLQALQMPLPPVNPTSTQTSGRFTNPLFQAIQKGDLTLKPGDENAAVKALQQCLQDMGFYVGDHCDGKFGPQTLKALKSFQDSKGLLHSGELNQETFNALKKIAPAHDQKLWEMPHRDQHVPSNDLGKLGRARAVVDLSEHRMFVYDKNNQVEKIYPVASGREGKETQTGIRKVYEPIADPSPYAWHNWPESKGRAYGDRMLDLSALDQKNQTWWHTDEELHGTDIRSSIGTKASSGCIRMLNEDIEEVFQNFKEGDLIRIQE